MSLMVTKYTESSSHWSFTYIQSTVFAVPSTPCCAVISARTRTNLTFKPLSVRQGTEKRDSSLSEVCSTPLRTRVLRTFFYAFRIVMLISKCRVSTPTTGILYPFAVVIWCWLIEMTSYLLKEPPCGVRWIVQANSRLKPTHTVIRGAQSSSP